MNNEETLSKLEPIKTRSLDNNEDKIKRKPTPTHNDDTYDSLSENDSSEYETDSDSDEGGLDEEGSDEEEYVNVLENPMYLVMSCFLENSDPNNRVNVTEAVLQLNNSVDRVANLLEKLLEHIANK
jgi:hypothetical protein